MKKDTIEIGVQVQPEDNATAQLMEGVLHTDRYLHMQKGDVLVMRYKGKIDRELANEIIKLQDALGKNGVEGIVIGDKVEVIGVIEHGGEM